jgi:hypothetical protein
MQSIAVAGALSARARNLRVKALLHQMDTLTSIIHVRTAEPTLITLMAQYLKSVKSVFTVNRIQYVDM